jgi:hypothetical protein
MAANKALKLTIPPLAGPPPSLSGLGGPEVRPGDGLFRSRSAENKASRVFEGRLVSEEPHDNRLL